MDFTLELMEEKRQDLYFYHILEKSSKTEELGARGSLGCMSIRSLSQDKELGRNVAVFKQPPLH